MAFLLVATAPIIPPVARIQAAPAGLPTLPAGWASSLELGLADGPGGAGVMRASAPYAFRYQYLGGGVRTSGNWSTWNPDGQFVSYYIEDSAQHNVIPVFTYYMIYQSSPGNTQSEASSIW